MNDITVIILTKNEEVNIRRCIASVYVLADRLIVVDSGSTDRTAEIAKELGAEVYEHEFETHGKQFNWALANLDIKTTWIFRLDADEVVTPELASEIIQECHNHANDDVSGFVMRFRINFMGRFLMHGGTYPFCKTTIFKHGKGMYDEQGMRDNVILSDGRLSDLKEDCLHYDFKNLEAWIAKHNWYSTLEADNVLTSPAKEQNEKTHSGTSLHHEAEKNEKLRGSLYYRLPKFFRARLYYWYRYYLQLGFLDGQPGRIYAFMQAYWYRYLVDAKITEQERKQKQ